MSRLATQMAQYGNTNALFFSSPRYGCADEPLLDSAFVNARMVDGAGIPQASSLKELQSWLCQRSSAQLDMYHGKDTDEFRLLTPAMGPIEGLVKTIMPVTKLGSIILVSSI